MTEAIAAEVGACLKAAREAQGLSIGEVAQSLKFAPRQLEALEQERFELLPGRTFVRGMVRAYARLLKLPPEPMLEGIAGRFEAPDANHLAARMRQHPDVAAVTMQHQELLVAAGENAPHGGGELAIGEPPVLIVGEQVFVRADLCHSKSHLSP